MGTFIMEGSGQHTTTTTIETSRKTKYNVIHGARQQKVKKNFSSKNKVKLNLIKLNLITDL